ncbi:U32 family peptidase [Spirochaetia bacterium 38H-sp]|uniref:U32 family peptidase n=1 Tax=Rarispira pelagica TaxID=3141764 RepID=A0ABU9UBM1_9SPIR
MELLSPAGNIEKLRYAYHYGADAAYIGLNGLSLRARADNFTAEQSEEIKKIKGKKKLYCALNIYFHPEDIDNLENRIDELKQFPIDAFIISDIGLLPIMKKHFPDTDMHLSTQANCTNHLAAKTYYDMGFKRIITARELSLNEIKRIKDHIPELEIEAFAHGAMCLAYSGRCFLSAWMADRSGNRGACAHSCRWEYRVLEERERPGEYYPIEEYDGYTTIMSSQDICMIDHLEELKQAGVDSIKIEGRMKSLYYVAIVSRAYRKALDALDGKPIENLQEYKEELHKVSHRQYSTGFFFGKRDIEKPADHTMFPPRHIFMGTVGKKEGDNIWQIIPKNKINVGEELEFIGPDIIGIKDKSYILLDSDKNPTDFIAHKREGYIKTDAPLEEGYIIRKSE